MPGLHRPGPEPDPAGDRGDLPEQQRRLGAGHTGREVVLGHPVPVIPVLLGVPGQIERAAQGVAGGAAGHQGGEIKDRQRYGHG